MDLRFNGRRVRDCEKRRCRAGCTINCWLLLNGFVPNESIQIIWRSFTDDLRTRVKDRRIRAVHSNGNAIREHEHYIVIDRETAPKKINRWIVIAEVWSVRVP